MGARFFLFLLLSWTFVIQQATAQTNRNEEEVLRNLIKSIPSPLELSSLIKEVGVQYNDTILNPPYRAASYNTDYGQALNLGIYSTDLGYVNVYKKRDTTAAAYLGSLVSVADGLNIESLIDFAAITQYAFANDLNGLLSETYTSFDKINKHLIEHERPDLSVLILTGGWLETLYLTCQVAKDFPNRLLDERIAEQKIVLDQILPILEEYQEGEAMLSLYEKLKELEDLFKKIKIKQKAKADENFRIARLGDLDVIIYGEDDDNKNKIKYKAEDLENILNLSALIRKQIVN